MSLILSVGFGNSLEDFVKMSIVVLLLIITIDYFKSTDESKVKTQKYHKTSTINRNCVQAVPLHTSRARTSSVSHTLRYVV